MAIPKQNLERAEDEYVKCRTILQALSRIFENTMDEIVKDSTHHSIEWLDKAVENVLRQYYSFGNQIIDYYGIGEEIDWGLFQDLGE